MPFGTEDIFTRGIVPAGIQGVSHQTVKCITAAAKLGSRGAAAGKENGK